MINYFRSISHIIGVLEVREFVNEKRQCQRWVQALGDYEEPEVPAVTLIESKSWSSLRASPAGVADRLPGKVAVQHDTRGCCQPAGHLTLSPPLVSALHTGRNVYCH